jgi:polygalacturonase
MIPHRTSRAALAALFFLGGLTHGAVAVVHRDYFEPVPEGIYAGVPFAMPRVPVPQIPDRSVSILEFGAVGDGQSLNTDAFARAIRHVAAQGGGRIVVPRGIWLTGPIVLLDHIQLHTEAGALVLFSPDRSLYPLVDTEFEGLRTLRCQSPLSAYRAQNIAITGDGIFDGSGQAWRPVKRMKMTDNQWRSLVASGGVVDTSGETWWPSEGALAGARGGFNPTKPSHTRAEIEHVRDFLRPVMVSLRECRNVLLDGPTFQNSPAWNIHPLRCENLVVRNLTVLNPWYSQNGDGLDVDSCRDGVIYGNTFDVGDDAICLKSGKDAEGRARGRPTENLVIRNNVVYHGHGGFIVGSEMSGGVRNIYAAELTFIGTNVGIRFKSNRGRGGVVENIHLTDITMINIPTEPIRFNLFYSGAAPTANQDVEVVDPATYLGRFPAVSEATPAFRNITIRNVVCRGAGAAMWIQGLPEMPVQNVRLENVSITATRGARLIDVAGIQFDGVRVESADGTVLHLHNAQDIAVRDSAVGTTGQPGETSTVRVDGPLTRGIDLRGLSPLGGPAAFNLGPNVAPEAVRLPGK